jgi:hypothetical protein
LLDAPLRRHDQLLTEPPPLRKISRDLQQNKRTAARANGWFSAALQQHFLNDCSIPHAASARRMKPQ